VSEVNEGVWWATAAMSVFWLGSKFIQGINRGSFRVRSERSAEAMVEVSSGMARTLLFYQFASLPVMLYLAEAGRSLYGSAFGAYAYDLPVPLQSGHIVAVVVLLERYLRERNSKTLFGLVVSIALFLVFTWFMREVSMFRGFYVAGVMIAGIAGIMHLKGRASYFWLILPIILLQPLFRTLGNTRYVDNEALGEMGVIEQTYGDEGLIETYWRFYDSRGDMNILDTFIAARASQPDETPYLISWLYAPFHIVPRAIWSDKPERGNLHDLAFMNGAPYCPGIAGFFWLDGGTDYWMLLCMLLLGSIIGYLDGYVLSMRDSYLRSALVGILVVNAMFLSRFLLWQALWQALYAVIPCLLLHRFLAPRASNVELDYDDEEAEMPSDDLDFGPSHYSNP
jgi:hypothetical protein